MEQGDIADFSISLPEDVNKISRTFQVESANHWPFLSPRSFVRGNSSFNFKYCPFSPYAQGRQDDADHEQRPIRSLSISFDSAEVPSQPVCKRPPSTDFFTTLEAFFNDRPIWLKNSLLQSLPEEEKPSKNHLKQYFLCSLLAWFAYSFENGPWRNTYVKLGYDPRFFPDSLVFQVIDFRSREEGSLLKKPYDHTFSGLPS